MVVAICGEGAGALNKKGVRAGPRWFGIRGLAGLRWAEFPRARGEQAFEQADQRTQDSLSETKGKNCEMEGREVHERNP